MSDSLGLVDFAVVLKFQYDIPLLAVSYSYSISKFQFDSGMHGHFRTSSRELLGEHSVGKQITFTFYIYKTLFKLEGFKNGGIAFKSEWKIFSKRSFLNKMTSR